MPHSRLPFDKHTRKHRRVFRCRRLCRPNDDGPHKAPQVKYHYPLAENDKRNVTRISERKCHGRVDDNVLGQLVEITCAHESRSMAARGGGGGSAVVILRVIFDHVEIFSGACA